MTDRVELLSDVWREPVRQAVAYLQSRGCGGRIGLILGSGLGNFVDTIAAAETLPYRDIPGFKTTTVAEHEGRLVWGQAAEVPVVVMQGRLHPYEGLPPAELLLPVAVLAGLGVDLVVVTNAAGGLNRLYTPGDLMVIADQVDLHGKDPLRELLRKEIPALPTRGPVVGPIFSREDSEHLRQAAAAVQVPVHSGTYASMWGPTYETKAEIGMLRRLGCDAVGMSTAYETVLLHRLGVRVVGLSCITNPARETGQPELSHQDVVEVGRMVRDRLAQVLLAFLPRVGR